MKKIWEWSYREVFLHDTNPDLCIKKLKKKRVKTYPLWVKISINQKIYTLIKFGIRDFNKYEYKQIKKAQKIIPENMPKHIELINGGLLQSVIKDYNWEVSKNMQSISQWKIWKIFFEKLQKIINDLMDNNIDLMDIRNNVIIQEYKKWEYKPMLFDFKRIWWKTYWWQFWLILKQQRKNKIYRRMKKVRNSLCSVN